MEGVSSHCRGWTRWPMSVPFNPHYSMILRFEQEAAKGEVYF